MPTRRQIAVLGLGRFGQAVALELTRLGHDVVTPLHIDLTHERALADLKLQLDGRRPA